jgi:copper chaperone CopZ
MIGNRKFIGLGLLATLAASLCCIAPLFALLAGVGGAASAFAPLEPFRPYLVGVAVLMLGVAWYQHFSRRKADACGCEPVKRIKFTGSFWFLTIATLFCIASLTLPYSVGYLYFDTHEKALALDEKVALQKAVFSVEGMTCSGCERVISQALHRVEGVAEAEVSYQKGLAVVTFNPEIIGLSDIEAAVRSTGYTATYRKLLE